MSGRVREQQTHGVVACGMARRSARPFQAAVSRVGAPSLFAGVMQHGRRRGDNRPVLGGVADSRLQGVRCGDQIGADDLAPRLAAESAAEQQDGLFIVPAGPLQRNVGLGGSGESYDRTGRATTREPGDVVRGPDVCSSRVVAPVLSLKRMPPTVPRAM